MSKVRRQRFKRKPIKNKKANIILNGEFSEAI